MAPRAGRNAACKHRRNLPADSCRHLSYFDKSRQKKLCLTVCIFDFNTGFHQSENYSLHETLRQIAQDWHAPMKFQVINITNENCLQITKY